MEKARGQGEKRKRYAFLTRASAADNINGHTARQRGVTLEMLAMQSDTAPTSGELIDEKEAATALAVAIGTLRNWRTRKQGPKFVKVGKRMVRYRRADLAEFITGVSDRGTA